MLRPLSRALAVGMVVALITQPAHSALTIGATRIVYAGDARSATVMVRNPSQLTYAAQAWVNTEADDTTTPVPFIPGPPLFRLDPGAQQLVRITGLPNDLPQDRESLFFFNVQEIPEVRHSDGGGNRLTLALRTRIKLFYRPKAIAGEPHRHLTELRWRSEDNGRTLVVNNPSPYHFTFSDLEASSGSDTLRITQRPMVAPFSEQRYSLPQSLATPWTVSFSAINDYGGKSALLKAQTLP
ncbi:fimbrial biogenesis chaperone [Pseudomonas sp. DC3000-4b1]|uniref:fimbrial biogenesis chaperone n=1 Tax=unclassified Pseudomonas TaxID=196821 RepID=UPI003CF27385